MSIISPQRSLTSQLYGGGIISTSQLLQGLNVLAPASLAWPSANLGLFVPFRIMSPVIVYKLVIGAGATAAGNFDVGIYDASGNKQVGAGSTAKGASTEQILDITDTRLGPGLYYFGMAADGTNNYIAFAPAGTSPVPLQKAKLAGVVQMASAFSSGLVQSATFATLANAYVPAIAALLRPY